MRGVKRFFHNHDEVEDSSTIQRQKEGAQLMSFILPFQTMKRCKQTNKK
jgi:hypothetical protein